MNHEDKGPSVYHKQLVTQFETACVEMHNIKQAPMDDRDRIKAKYQRAKKILMKQFTR